MKLLNNVCKLPNAATGYHNNTAFVIHGTSAPGIVESMFRDLTHPYLPLLNVIGHCACRHLELFQCSMAVLRYNESSSTYELINIGDTRIHINGEVISKELSPSFENAEIHIIPASQVQEVVLEYNADCAISLQI